jgi:hypothetical protein
MAVTGVKPRGRISDGSSAGEDPEWGMCSDQSRQFDYDSERAEVEAAGAQHRRTRATGVLIAVGPGSG